MTIQLGKNNEYSLSDQALNHIINGDFSERQERNGRETKLIKVISGGLHTINAWRSFLNHRTDIKHGLIYKPEENEKWYYARELKNGIILLRIPRDCFQSNAANLTRYPQTFYKSGYLWKTLFPKNYTQSDIIDSLKEALNNVDEEETTDDIIIGYAKTDDILKVIKIRIQVRGKEILSAFPTWDQPMSGNNGKPFSHIDSINTIISASSVFCNDEEKIIIENTQNKWNEEFLVDYLKTVPEFVINRKAPKKDKNRDKQFNDRKQELEIIAQNLGEEEVLKLVGFLLTDENLRYQYDFINFLFLHNFPQINRNLKCRNSVSIYQNFQEILYVVSCWDLINNNRYALQIILKYLENKFIKTGGLDQWESKRISNLMLEIVKNYNNSEISIQFLNALSISPSRIGFYCEYNLNPFFYKDPTIIGMTGLGVIPLNETHFYQFVAQILGINYTYNFKDDYNIKLAKAIQKYSNPNGGKIVKYSIIHSIASDFNFFPFALLEICQNLEFSLEVIKCVNTIVFDYHRCLAANIQRIFAKYRYTIAKRLEFGDEGFIKYTKIGHEHKFLSMINQLFITDLVKVIKQNGFDDEADKIENKYMSIYKEVRKIPMPKSVPEYLRSDEFIKNYG